MGSHQLEGLSDDKDHDTQNKEGTAPDDRCDGSSSGNEDEESGLQKRALDVVGSVVRDWDPYGLIASGAPTDEFDSEIVSVVTQIPRIKTEKEAALALSRVFSSAFEPQRFTPDQCADAGKKLFTALSANGFVDL